jgi:hypothetical protein
MFARIFPTLLLLACLASGFTSPPRQATGLSPYELEFSTYFGGKNWEHARDVCVDSHGNVYMVGGTASDDFPTTPGAFNRSFNTGGNETGDAGQCDAFVAKFDPGGKLLWSTYLGGPNYDRAYGVEVDREGHVCVAGRAGPGFPVTQGSFQTRFGGSRYNKFYGSQNGFVAKLDSQGHRLMWASYVGVGELCRDIALDTDGDIYLPLGWNTSSESVTQPGWFGKALAGALQKKAAGGIDCGVVKVRSDGTAVLWATWLGGSDKETQEASVRVDSRKRVYLLCNTRSKDMPTTEGAFSRRHNGDEDGYLALLNPRGSQLIFGTYIGGSGVEWALNTHNLAIDETGNSYVSLVTESADFPTTQGAFCRERKGANDIAIVKISPTGALVSSTFLGGSDQENPDGIYADKAGNVFIAGQTTSRDFPVSQGAFQSVHGGGDDAVVVVLAADFTRLLYSTLMGGKGVDAGRSACLGSDGSFYLTGATDSEGWPLRSAYQNRFAGGKGGYGNGDCILARLKPTRK